MFGTSKLRKPFEAVADLLHGIIEDNLRKNQEAEYLGNDVFPAEEDGPDYSSPERTIDRRLILLVSRAMVPLDFATIRFFSNPRICGWEVAIGKPLLCFAFDDCFEVQITEMGRRLADALGQTESRPSH